MIWIQNQLVGVELGQQIILECLSEAYPKSINYWTKENGVIIANGEIFYNINITVNYFSRHTYLIVGEILYNIIQIINNYI